MSRNNPKSRLFLMSFLSGVLLSITFLLLTPQKTHAIDMDTILQKALANGINYCYSNGAMKAELEDARSFSVSSVVSTSGAIVIPSGSTINCRQAFAGKDNSLQAVYGKTPSTPVNLGYTFTKSTQTVQRCAHITYRYQGKNKQTNDVCFEVMNNNNDYPNGSLELPVVKNNGSGPLSLFLNGDGNIELYDSAHPNAVTSTFSYGSNWGTFESNMNKAVNYIKSVQVPDSKDPNVHITPFNDPNYKSEESSSDSYQKYTLDDTSAAALAALSFYTGKSSFDEVKFTNADMKFMWRQAVQSMIDDKTIYLQENDCHAGKEDAKKAAGTGYIFYNTDTNLWCPVDISNNNKTYPVVESSMTHLMLATPEQILQATESENAGYETDKDSCNQKALSSRRAAESWINQSTTPDDKRKKARNLIDELDGILKKTNTFGKPENEQIYWYEENGAIICYSYTELNDQPGGGPTTGDNTNPGSNNNNNNGSPDDIDDCTGVAGSLGWILCPVLKIVSEGVDDIYDSYVQEQFLEIDPTKVTVNGSIYKSWAVIRNVANIIFVILFLIVLLSQLTGIGLTNYSIKKMLPRLIVIAVVVNVSFLVCQFAVDVSNVLGYGLNALFDGMSSTAGLTGSLNQTTSSTTGGGAATWVEILGVAIAASTIGSWLTPLLLTLLSCAISVFFGAIILAARQAAVYILIVLAPAAIVCYALPNAKRAVFDRWLKIFTSMLMVFPICGALVGGGYFASNILLSASSGGFFLTLVAMLLRVAPFFLIPSLVRGSMTALGNVGARISNLGNRLGGFTTGMIRKSDAYQRTAELGEQARGRGIALRHRILSGITGGMYTGSRGSKRRLARAVGLQESRLRGDAKAGAIAAGGFLTRGQASDIMAAATATEEDQGIKDAEAGFKLDPDLDTGDHTAVNHQLEEHLNALQADPTSVEARRKVKALMKILLESDDGRGDLFNTVRDFTEANRDSDATKILGKYLGSDENMAKIKAYNQRGLQNLVQDINRGNSIRSALDYGALGTDKISAGAVGGMDTSALASQVAAATGGALTGASLQGLADVYTKALTSENAAKEIKPEMVANLNEIRRQAYMANNGGSDAGFKALNPGDVLKVRRTAAPVPAGWTASGVWVGGGSGPTLQQQVAYNEWAKHKAEVDRHNSQL